jgi:hypothetical protein
VVTVGKGEKIKSFRGYTFANEDVQVYKEKLNYWREKWEKRLFRGHGLDIY